MQANFTKWQFAALWLEPTAGLDVAQSHRTELMSWKHLSTLYCIVDLISPQPGPTEDDSRWPVLTDEPQPGWLLAALELFS